MNHHPSRCYFGVRKNLLRDRDNRRWHVEWFRISCRCRLFGFKMVHGNCVYLRENTSVVSGLKTAKATLACFTYPASKLLTSLSEICSAFTSSSPFVSFNKMNRMNERSKLLFDNSLRFLREASEGVTGNGASRE
jgi:hypothetical protein